jgi:hypothetical protein
MGIHNLAANLARIPSTDSVVFACPVTAADLTATDDIVSTDDQTISGSLTVTENITITGPGIDTQSVPSADHGTTVDLFEIAATAPVNTTGTNTLNFLTIDAAIGNASGGTNSVVGLQIDAITGDAQVTETAINIGSGWDSGITCASVASFTGGLKVGTSENLASGVAGIHLSAVVAVTIPSIADGKVDQVDVDVAAAFTVAPAVGDVVFPVAQEALMTSAVVLGAQVIATDSVRVTFGCIEGGTVTGAAKNFKFYLHKLI